MAVTISATLLSGSPAPVQVIVTGIPSGSPFEVRGQLGLDSWPIPGGKGVGDGAQVVLIDTRAPLRSAVTYTVQTEIDTQYAWTGTPDASTSTKTTAAGTVTNLATNPSFEGVGSEYNVRTNLYRRPLWGDATGLAVANSASFVVEGAEIVLTTLSGGPADSGVNLNASNVNADRVLGVQTFSVDLTGVTAGVWRISAQGTALSVHGGSPDTVVGAGETKRLIGSLEVTDVTGSLAIYVLRATASVVGKVRIGKPLLEVGALAQPYFDHTFSPDSDLVPRSSVPNNSVSYLSGNYPTTVSSRGTIVSQQWARSGVRSARIIPTGTSNDTFCSPSGDAGGLRLGMLPGKTYTAKSVIRLLAPQMGALNGLARKVALYYRNQAGSYRTIESTQAPNTAGEHEIIFTFTAPADSTELFIRLYNGASIGNGDVWWDDLLVVEGVYDGPYFDGDTPSGIIPAQAGSTPVTIPYPEKYVIQSLDGRQKVDFAWRDNGLPRDPYIDNAAFPVPGRRRPPVRFAPGGDGTGSLEIRADRANGETLHELLMDGRPVVVRTDGQVRDLKPVDIIMITAAPSTLFGGDGGISTQRIWSLSYLLVDDPEPDVVLGAATWADFNTIYAGMTWAEFNQEWQGQTWAQFNAYDWAQRL